MSVALAMIVRDEELILDRCLRAAAPVVDAIVIVDTGSTDATLEIAGNYGAKVYERDWRNFGENRTELIELARQAGDYLLLLDADDELLTLTRDPVELAYTFQVVTPGTTPYRQPRLVSTAIEWRYVGVTHEYLTSDDVPVPGAGPVGGSLRHHCDGSRWPRKLDDDLELLRAEFWRDPTDARVVFYLANTLRDLGRGEDAIPLYKLRTTLGGWQQEVDAAAAQLERLEAGDSTPVVLPSPVAA